MSFKIIVGMNYDTNEQSSQSEFNADTPHQCGSIIGKAIEADKYAINFMITVVRGEDSEDGNKTARDNS